MFHFNLDFDDSKILTLSLFHKQLFHNWCKFRFCFDNIQSSILSQPIWYNKSYVEEFEKQDIISLYDLFNTKMSLKRGIK